MRSRIKIIIVLSILIIGVYCVTNTPILSDFSSSVNVISITGHYKNYQLGLVKDPGVEYDSYGNYIVLINNNDAKNPTYSQLLDFLRSDKTDQYPYQYVNASINGHTLYPEGNVDVESIKEIIDGIKQPNPPRICVDFVEMLHNNAEKAGIKCAYVTIRLSGYNDTYHLGVPSNTNHALDAFDTTDRGLMYIDCTGAPAGTIHPTRMVTSVNVQVGEDYVPINVFPESDGLYYKWGSMGKVTSIYLTWNGNWDYSISP